MEDFGVVQGGICLQVQARSLLCCVELGYPPKHPSLRPRSSTQVQLGRLRALMQLKWGPH